MRHAGRGSDGSIKGWSKGGSPTGKRHQKRVDGSGVSTTHMHTYTGCVCASVTVSVTVSVSVWCGSLRSCWRSAVDPLLAASLSFRWSSPREEGPPVLHWRRAPSGGRGGRREQEYPQSIEAFAHMSSPTIVRCAWVSFTLSLFFRCSLYTLTKSASPRRVVRAPLLDMLILLQRGCQREEASPAPAPSSRPERNCCCGRRGPQRSSPAVPSTRRR